MKRSVSAPVGVSSNNKTTAQTPQQPEEVASKKKKMMENEEPSTKINQDNVMNMREKPAAKSLSNEARKKTEHDLSMDMDIEMATPAFLVKTASSSPQNPANLRLTTTSPKACARPQLRSLTQCVKLITNKFKSPSKKKDKCESSQNHGENETMIHGPGPDKNWDQRLVSITTTAVRPCSIGSPKQRISSNANKFKVFEDKPNQTLKNVNKVKATTPVPATVSYTSLKPGIRDITNEIKNTSRTPVGNPVSKFKVPSPPGSIKGTFTSPGHNGINFTPSGSNKVKTSTGTGDTSKFKTPSPPTAPQSNASCKRSRPQSSIIPFTKPLSMCNASKLITPSNSKPALGTSSMKRTPPMCECGRRSNRKTVQTPGPNVGRVFFACPLGRKGTGKKSGCGFFKWEEQMRTTGSSPNLLSRGLTNPTSSKFPVKKLPCANNSYLNNSTNTSKQFGNFTPLCSGFGNGIGSKALGSGYNTPLAQPNFNTPQSDRSGMNGKKTLGLGRGTILRPPL